MKFFLDTADVAEIKEALSWGILDGVTTNPSHVAKTGRKFREVAGEICKLVPGDVSLETVSLDAAGIVKEAHELVKFGRNVVVKIPIMKEGLKAVKQLADEGIRSNVTVCFSASQALLAAKAGAAYISPFVGRLDDISHDGMEVAQQIRTIYTNYGFKTQLLVAAVRHPLHVLQAALMGADVTTMRFNIFEQLVQHPLTDIGIKMFLDDWKAKNLSIW
ncbi:MAG: fructose-6-phosphate aldolase [Verrucomicrobia bacterium]|nr:fructose-6-phosphate aldolase [Verrucomicrobiota bacterium]